MATQGERRRFELGSHSGANPAVGPWLAAMEQLRGLTLTTLARIESAGLGQEFLDWRGSDGNDNWVGSVLYHVAHVEVGWLYFDLLATGGLPQDLEEIVPIGGRDEQGRLPHITGLGFGDLWEKLALTRQRYLEVIAPLTSEEWRTASEPEGEDYAVTPAWATFHLLEHEAGHLYEVRRMVRKWREAKA